MLRTRPWSHAVILVCALSFTGCGSLGEAAAQGTDASLRALIDFLLTDLTNQVVESLNQDDQQDADDSADGSDDDADGTDDGTDGGDDGTGGDDGAGDDGAGDDPVTRGETLVADNCAGCHGADGASGFAQNIQGAAEELIADRTSGANGHLSIELSEQDSADIAAYLASF